MNLRGPLYEYIEFCRNAERLWRKLQEGNWDWIGVHPKGQFVLGRPRLNLEERMIGIPSTLTVAPGAQEGKYGVMVSKWYGSPAAPRSQWYTNEAEARTRYEELVERLDTPEQTPILAWVHLIVDGFPADERYIVHTPPPNYP